MSTAQPRIASGATFIYIASLATAAPQNDAKLPDYLASSGLVIQSARMTSKNPFASGLRRITLQLGIEIQNGVGFVDSDSIRGILDAACFKAFGSIPYPSKIVNISLPVPPVNA